MEHSLAPIGILGGTFDPIHYGHLRTGYELLQLLGLSQLRYLPCGQPPHRGRPVAPGEVRLRMARAAVSGHPGMLVDDRELRRDGPSYSVETLLDLRRDFPDRSLCLIVGMDAFVGIPSWHRWQELFELAHLVVARRPGWEAVDPGLMDAVLKQRLSDDIADLHRDRSGRIYVHSVTQLEISSTAIRKMVASGQEPRFLMPDKVCEIIKQSGCYSVAGQMREKAFDRQ
jgi:nicotinate-nucleotide adenylyltransferase